MNSQNPRAWWRPHLSAALLWVVFAFAWPAVHLVDLLLRLPCSRVEVDLDEHTAGVGHFAFCIEGISGAGSTACPNRRRRLRRCDQGCS